MAARVRSCSSRYYDLLDNRNVNLSPAYQHFGHKSSKFYLWASRCLSPSWAIVQQEHDVLGDGDARSLSHNREYEKEFRAEASAFVSLLKACARSKDLDRGVRLHADLLGKGLLEQSSFISVAVIDLYAKCGVLLRAKEILVGLTAREVVSWNALIAGYTQHGQGTQALLCFESIKEEGIAPDEVTFSCILKACGCVRAACKGEEIHGEIARQGLLGKDIVLHAALVDMYAKCGDMVKAREVLEQLPTRDIFAWTSLITGYAQMGQGKEAILCFELMQQEGVSPNAVTFTCALKACSSVGAVDKGEQIHNEIARLGLLKSNHVLSTALIDMYAKCGALSQAQRMLADLPTRNVISWNALIAGYSQQGQGKEALICFDCMQWEGFAASAVTLACALNACGSIGMAYKGGQIHAEIARRGLLESNLVLGNALIDMYAKCAALARAEQMLDRLPLCDVVSWSTLIAGYVHHGLGEEALSCFGCMQCKGIFPNAVTFTSVLKACSILRAPDRGEQVHDNIIRQGLLGNDAVLSTALVDMYAKCGAFVEARRVLHNLPAQGAVFWNALMAGYARQGQAGNAFGCFKRLERDGLSPDAVTFCSVLKVLAQ